MIDRRVVGAVLSPHAEADRVGDLVGDSIETCMHRVEREVGADRRVAAGDVEPHAHDRHLIVVRGDTADRHDVAHVTISHERRIDRVLAHMLELADGLLVVLSEDLHARIDRMGSVVAEPLHVLPPANDVCSGARHHRQRDKRRDTCGGIIRHRRHREHEQRRLSP